MSSPTVHPIPLEDLIAYQLHDLDDARCEALEEHLFACASCTSRLETLQRLGDGIGNLVRRGEVLTGLTVDTLENTAERGLKVRTYALGPGESVACTAAPDDDVVAMRLRVPAAEAASLSAADLQIETTSLSDGATRAELLRGCAVDVSRGECVVILPGNMIRALPRAHVRVTLRRPGSADALGDYLFDHTPWAQLPG